MPYHRAWLGRPLAQLEASLRIRISFLVRFGAGLLPERQTVVQEGDLLYAAVLSSDLDGLRDIADIAPEES